MSDRLEHRVAVVGMGCRYPGAPDVAALWDLLRHGRSGLTTLTEEGLRAAGVPSRLVRHPDYVPVTGLIPDPMSVDPEGLGLSENEAELMDPQQRVFLECSVEALEAAGLGQEGHRGSVGVFAGQAFPGHLVDNLGDRFHPRGGRDPIDSLHLHGLNVGDYLPARVAWQLGFTGPTVAVGGTCATSLMAIHLAVNALLAEECDTALAGGVSLRLPQEHGYLSVPDGPFSRDGKTRAYGVGATGTVFTQGSGVVVLRRLTDALRDGDPVRAVVRGTAIGNDGLARAGFSAPSVDGQARVIAEALALADVEPTAVGLIEGHGTGTALGDPIEVRALREVFGPAAEPWCKLGSIKSMIGHTDSAAGVAGFIKAVLAIEHGLIPPTLDAEEPSEALSLVGSPFTLAARAEPWNATERIAGVSAFGIGGINAHAVLGQAPERIAASPRAAAGPPPLLFSAATPEALERRTTDLRDAIHLAGTLAHGARVLPWRRAVVAGEPTPAIDAPTTRPRLVTVFPGGGAQSAGMAAGLYAAEPTFRSSFDATAAIIAECGGTDPRLVALDPGATTAQDPAVGLPALAAAELAYLDLLADYGVTPDMVLGHSLGEYVAAVAAGAMDRRDALALVVARGRLMSDLPAGALLSVSVSADEAAALLQRHPDLDVAAVNGDALCVLAGPEQAIAALESDLADTAEHRRLHVAVAAHSRVVEPIVSQIQQVASGFPRPRPTSGFVSCLDGRQHTEALAADHWATHLRQPVRLDLATSAALAHAERAIVLQAGPGGNLIAHLTSDTTSTVLGWPHREDVTDPEQATAALQRALSHLWSHNYPIDLDRLIPRGRTVPLPAYPWQRRALGQPHRLPADGTVGARADSGICSSEPLQRPVWQHEPRRPHTRPDAVRVHLTNAPDALRDTFVANGVTVRDDAPIVVHLSAPADLDALRSETERFAQFARDWDGVRGLLHLTLGAEDVVGTESINPFATATTGLARVLAQEVDGLRWATVDLDPAAPAWDLLVGEVARLQRIITQNTTEQPHRALRGARVWSRRWESWQPEAEPEVTGPQVWVITGGMGSVGLALAARLEADNPYATVVLAGRSLPQPGEARHSAVGRLSRTQVALVDVAEPGALTGLLQRIQIEHGRVDVVVHAAVQVDLAPLAELDATSIDAAFAPKIRGALALGDALATLPTRPQVIMLSSAAGTIGGFGLGAYAAAGRFLDGYAVAQDWTTLDLDRVRLGTADEASSAAEISMRHAIDLEDVVTTIGRVSALDVRDYLAASPTELNTRTARLDTTRVEHASSDASQSPLSGWEAVVADVWSRILRRSVTSGQDDFFALGGHSLLATRVLAEFRNEHEVEVRLRDLLASPTVSACAALIANRAPTVPRTPPAAETAEAPAMDEHRFGLTRIQHAYWIGRTRGLDPSRGEGQGVGCHFYLEYAATDLDIPRYQSAWRRVVERHPMLRAVITEQGEHRLIDLPEEWVPQVVDLRQAPDAERQVSALRERWSTRVADPARWPLIVPVIVQLPDGTCRVMLSVDVLTCDSASWMLVDREIRAAYLDPAADLGPQPPGLAVCLAALEARSASTGRARAKAHWMKRLSALPQAPAIAKGHSDERRPHFTRLAARVSAQTWQAVCQEARQRRVTPTAAVLARYRQALARWSGQDHFTVTLTVFDRPDIAGFNSVVGEFSSMVLHEAVAAHAPVWEQARLTQERLVDDLDHREFTGLEVLTEWSRLRGRSENIPVVFTSMIGLDRIDDGTAHDHEWLGEQVYGVSQTPQVWLDHQAFEQRDGLVLQWDVCDTAVDLGGARREFDAYVASFSGSDSAVQAQPEDATAPIPEAAPTPAPPETSTVAPAATTNRETVVLIWADLLGLAPEEIGDETFLALGGDSLLTVRMGSELRRRVGVRLPLNQIRADITVNDLLELISQGSSSTATLPLLRLQDSREPFALLPLQQGYFVGQSGGWEISYDTAHVTTDVELTLPNEHPDVVALEQSLQRAADAVAAHQPMVRAHILPDGTQRFRAVDDPDGRTPARVIDLRDHADPDGELDRLRRHWAISGPDPSTGPGVHVDVVLLGGRRGRLHVSSSLLIMDGWAASVYDRELFAQLNEPGTLPAPLDLTFGDYVASVTSDQAQADREVHRQWWSQRIDSLPRAPRLPRRDGAPGDGETMTMREFRLAPKSWHQLRTICQDQGVTPATALLGVFALALQHVTGQQELLLNSMQHNRIPIHPDVDRLVGAFSRTALLPLRLPGGTLHATLHSLADQVAEAGRHHLVTAIEVGREVGRRSGGSHSIAPVVFQSTLGLDAALGGDLNGQLGAFGQIQLSAFHQDIRTPQVELELRFFELDGELIGSMASVDELFVEGIPAHLLSDVEHRVAALLDAATWQAPLPDVEAPAWAEDDDLPDAVNEADGHVETCAVDPAAVAPLAAIWAQLLALDEAPLADDDFFSLGGDSLLAMRMLTKVRTDVGLDVHPRTFLQHPTLAGLLRSDQPTLQAAAPVAARRDIGEALVELRSGTGRPIFLLHPSGGDILCYVELARLLRTERPVVALSDPGLDGHTMPPTIAGTVDVYRRLITQAQPEGPWTFGGWSMGGTMAQELARRITADGGAVDALVMIDSNSPARIIRLSGLSPADTEARQRLRQLRSIEAYLGLDLGHHDDWRTLAQALVDRGAAPRVTSFEQRFAVFCRHMDALAMHEAGPLGPDVPTLLVRAAQRSPRNSGEGMGIDDIDDADLGWSSWICGPFRVTDSEAHHYSILQTPAVTQVAEQVSDFVRSPGHDIP